MVRCKVLAYVAVLGLCACELSGQACCSGGSPISSNVQALATGERALHLMISYEYNNLSDLQQGTRNLSVNNRHRATNSVLVRLGYSNSRRLAFFGLYSAISQLERNTDLVTGQESTVRVRGPGDLLLMGQYALIGSGDGQLTFSTGVKLPTGATDRRSQRDILLAPDLQPGTGSVDLVFAMQYARRAVFSENDGFSALGTFRISDHADRLTGLQTYKFGNEVQFQVGYHHDLYTNAVLVSPDVGIKVRRTAEDQTNRADTPNTGGTWVSLLPALTLQWPMGWAIQLHTELPLLRDLQGIQLTTSYKLGIRTTYHVPLQTGIQN